MFEHVFEGGHELFLILISYHNTHMCALGKRPNKASKAAESFASLGDRSIHHIDILGYKNSRVAIYPHQHSLSTCILFF